MRPVMPMRVMRLGASHIGSRFVIPAVVQTGKPYHLIQHIRCATIHSILASSSNLSSAHTRSEAAKPCLTIPKRLVPVIKYRVASRLVLILLKAFERPLAKERHGCDHKMTIHSTKVGSPTLAKQRRGSCGLKCFDALALGGLLSAASLLDCTADSESVHIDSTAIAARLQLRAAAVKLAKVEGLQTPCGCKRTKCKVLSAAVADPCLGHVIHYSAAMRPPSSAYPEEGKAKCSDFVVDGGLQMVRM